MLRTKNKVHAHKICLSKSHLLKSSISSIKKNKCIATFLVNVAVSRIVNQFYEKVVISSMFYLFEMVTLVVLISNAIMLVIEIMALNEHFMF